MLNIPVLSLIHEFAGYVMPAELFVENALISQSIVVPAKIVKDSIMQRLSDIQKSQVSHKVLVRPQGKLPFIPPLYGCDLDKTALLDKIGIAQHSDYKIVVGAGSIDIRKGVDLFISMAKYIKKYYKGKCKFVWVGDGLKDDDYKYSFWLKREVELFQLENNFIFLEHQHNLDEIFAIADIYCLTSRMDPFPNIAIDALQANLPIACFREASGTVEFLEKYNADSIVVDYLDTNQLAIEISEYLSRDDCRSHINAKLVNDHLCFDSYINFLIQQIDHISSS